MGSEEIGVNRKVLLIEDSPPDAVLTESIVSRHFSHTKITSAASMREAYNSLKTQTFDLILLDLNLPDAYGPASVKELRRFCSKTPIIVLTGLGSDLTKSEAEKFGASTVVFKHKLLDVGFKSILVPYLD